MISLQIAELQGIGGFCPPQGLTDFEKPGLNRVKEQFLRVWENFAPPPEIRPSFFAPGTGNLTKKMPGWPGFARSKKFSGGCPGGCTQLELSET